MKTTCYRLNVPRLCWSMRVWGWVRV